MNAKVRNEIAKHIVSLNEIKDKVESIMENEQEKYDNMPEGLQDSERADEMLDVIDNLDSAVSSIEEAVEYLENC